MLPMSFYFVYSWLNYRSTDADLLRESAASVRDEGIITFAVGVGEANENELRVSSWEYICVMLCFT